MQTAVYQPEEKIMKRILAFALSVAVNAALLVSLQHVGEDSLPQGHVFVTDVTPAAVQLAAR